MDFREKNGISDIGFAHAIFACMCAIAMHLIEKPATTCAKLLEND